MVKAIFLVVMTITMAMMMMMMTIGCDDNVANNDEVNILIKVAVTMMTKSLKDNTKERRLKNTKTNKTQKDRQTENTRGPEERKTTEANERKKKENILSAQINKESGACKRRY